MHEVLEQVGYEMENRIKKVKGIEGGMQMRGWAVDEMEDAFDVRNPRNIMVHSDEAGKSVAKIFKKYGHTDKAIGLAAKAVVDSGAAKLVDFGMVAFPDDPRLPKGYHTQAPDVAAKLHLAGEDLSKLPKPGAKILTTKDLEKKALEFLQVSGSDQIPLPSGGKPHPLNLPPAGSGATFNTADALPDNLFPKGASLKGSTIPGGTPRGVVDSAGYVNFDGTMGTWDETGGTRGSHSGVPKSGILRRLMSLLPFAGAAASLYAAKQYEEAGKPIRSLASLVGMGIPLADLGVMATDAGKRSMRGRLTQWRRGQNTGIQCCMGETRVERYKCFLQAERIIRKRSLSLMLLERDCAYERN